MAGDSATEVRQAVRALLVADAGVSAIVGSRVFDVAHDSDAFPYVVFGDEISDPWDGVDLDGEEHFISIHGWDDQSGHTVRARTLKAALRSALHEAALTVSGNDTVICRVADSRLLKGGENDRLAHVFMRLRVVTH